MKKSITLIAILLCLGITILASCNLNKIGNGVATVGNNGGKVTLFHNSDDVKFQENGQDLQFVQAYVAHKKAGYAAASSGMGASGGYLVYTKGIQLDKSIESHVVTIIRNDKKVSVTITNKSKPYLDVTAELGESQMMSWADLQTEFLKEHTGKRKKG
jgi:hypothetical protein